jgi:hypothetical protein
MTPMIMNPFRFASVAASTEYASMYESRSELTTVQKQHFVEWFSGSALDSIWTFNGTNDAGMKDAVDGGYYLEPPSAANVIMYMNDKRQYAFDGSVYIGVVGGNLVGSRVDVIHGLAGESEFSGATADKAVYKHDSSVGFKMNTSDGSTETATSTTSGNSFVNDSWNVAKIETKASSVVFSLDGVADGTITTTLPDGKMQPASEVRSIASDGTDYGKIRYVECYNT